MINICWQEFGRGWGIGRPPNSALYGARDSSHLCGARRTWRSRSRLASLLVPRENQFLGPSRRIWKGDPFIGEYGDAAVEVMVSIE